MKVTEEAVLANAKSIAYNQFAQYGMTNLGDDVITEHAKRILANEEYREQIVEKRCRKPPLRQQSATPPPSTTKV